MEVTSQTQKEISRLLQIINDNPSNEKVNELSELIEPFAQAYDQYDPLKLLQSGIPLSAFKKSQKSRANQAEILKRQREKKRRKYNKWRRKKYIQKLEVKGVDWVEGEKQLDPERWIPKHLRKANRKRNKNKGGGGQGVLDEKLEARLDVKAKIEKKVKASSSKKYGKKKGKGRRR